MQCKVINVNAAFADYKQLKDRVFENIQNIFKCGSFV